ncbi:Holliday junction resolvase RuvX [Buchnera aphidicola (Aphis craccivora)]|uniref:Putative pre-16S rRNA nuclease n=1 Tax=Buchnera aphidicola (Aphis craccivora) TaxID=466616 RepID=A0A4D6XSL5_9GAMM|nr:Holliday junction resolvase RuvX [Buchnera aphidicola]QCI16771.1 Holliday junction resolvase RuvX [Buchnera aphidicola (Aphis craccivora)]WAI18073.1 MAG: Holliday junction resolvase RuvX [Buchnera aphidicola (Aphis craccivora)]
MMVIAFDFGIKNIGVAVGEKIIKKGKALNKLAAHNGRPNWNDIKYLLKMWKPSCIIVGLPLNMDGTRQNITKKAEIFANLLKNKFNASVELHDERLSTKEARSLIFNQYGFKAFKKDQIHSTAAVVILESWFNQSL